ncbi:MAG: VOC family protein [Acetobacteraceae bacterium]|nr:VOC family protein [Acetobacteraceae bacterium]MBV8577896.1 VOC family protein [Acetobacteraceae bacterium]
MRFDHLGVIASDLASGRTLLESTIGVGDWSREYEEPAQDVFAQFGRCASGVCYEVIAPRSAASPIARASAGKTNTINHVAYLVDDLAREAERLADVGLVAIGAARPGCVFDNRPVQFFVSSSRFVLELIEAPDHEHAFGTFAAQTWNRHLVTKKRGFR